MTDTNINIVFSAIDQGVKKVLNEMQRASTAASSAMNNMVADTRKQINIGRSQVLAVQDTSKAFDTFSQSLNESGTLMKALESTFPRLSKEVDGIRRIFHGYAKALIATNNEQSRFSAKLEEGETQLDRIGSFALKETIRRTSEFARGLGGLQVQMQKLNASDMPAWASSIEKQGANTQTLAMQNHLLAGNIRTVGNELRFKNSAVMRDVGFNERTISQLGRLNDSYSSYYKMVDAATGQSKQFGSAVKQFGDYFGKSNQQVQVWGKALTDSSRAVTRLKNESNMLGGVMPGLSNSIKTAAVAYGTMQKNIDITSGRIKVLNKEGLDTLGISEDSARRLQLLSKNYNVYEQQLAQVTRKSKENSNVFKSLASIYDKNTLALERISKAVNDADRVTGQYAASYKNKAQVVGEATKEGQKYLRQAQLIASEESKLRIASDLVNGSYVVKNDRLKSTLKNLTNHKKSILEAATIYGKGSVQLKEYAKGLVQLGYKSTDSSKHTQNLRTNFLNTIKAVDQYRQSFPELTKNLDALSIHQAKVAGQVTQVGTKLRIHSKEGVQAAKMTEEQASSVGMLARSYSQFENLIGKVAKVSKDHVPIIRSLAETYGYTQQNVRFLDKAWDDALTASKREIGLWKERKNVLKSAGQDYSAIDEDIKRLSDGQLLNQKIADNFQASMTRAGLGVSSFAQFVQKGSDKLKLSGPLQTAYIDGLRNMGITAGTTGAHVQKLGTDFHRVYETMLTMGARAGLSSKQMEGLMSNTKTLTDVTKGWANSYKSMHGSIYALDDITGNWLKTQVELDQAGKAQLITSKRLGASYGSHFGEVEKDQATWTRTVNNASRALGILQTKANTVGGTLPEMSRQIKVTDLALGMLQGNIDLTGNKISVLNQKGLDQIHRNRDQAEQLQILSKSFDTYQTELTKVGGAASKNGQVFASLAKQYNFNDEALSGLSNTIKQSEKITASAARRYLDKAAAVGVSTDEGKAYLDQANQIVSAEGRLAVASQLLTNKYEIQNGKLVDLGKDMTAHSKLMNEVAVTYGAGTPRFRAFEQGLRDLKYESQGTSIENRKLGNSFLQTFNAVDRYKTAYPELAKDLNAVEVHHARLAKAVSLVEGRFRINNETGMTVLKQTQAQASEMGMLSKTYHEMESLIQRVSSYSKEHGTIIKDLANRYGYTETNTRLLSKAYKEASTESARMTTQWNNERQALLQQGKDVSEATKNLNHYSNQQFVAERTAKLYEAAIIRSGIGVSKYSQFVQLATDKLQLSTPLQSKFVSGLQAVGVVSNSTGMKVKTLGGDFARVYESLLSMGIRARLSSDQLNQLMSNTDFLTKATSGLNNTYKINKGVLYEVDKVTGKLLQTQIHMDQQGKVSIETAKRMGSSYGTALGQAESSTHSWFRALDKSSKAIGHLRAQAQATGGEMPKLAQQLKVPSIALGLLQGNIEIVGNRIRLLNEEGRKLSPYSKEQAHSLGILSDSYNAYYKGLALASKGGAQNVEIFKQLASRYTDNAEMLKTLNPFIKEVNKASEQLSNRFQKQAKALGETTAEGQEYLIKSRAILTTQGKMWTANQLLNESYDVQNGQLINLSSTMKQHRKMMFDAVSLYGKNSEQFRAFETGLKKVGYVADDASKANRELGTSFSKTFHAVEKYKRLYPEMAKNLDAINFDRASSGIRLIGNEFRISNAKQLKASQLTRNQASEMGMLTKTYDEMEGVIQRITNQNLGHEKIVQKLANTYGYTRKNAHLISKAYDEAYGSSKILTEGLQKQMQFLSKGSSQYIQAEKDLKQYSSTQYLAEATTKNFKAALDKTGYGVSEFSQHVAKVSEKLKLSESLSGAYKRGMIGMGVTSKTASHEVRVTGMAFEKVFDAMLKTGVQANLTDEQLKKLMNNSRKMKEVVQGLGESYQVQNGRILALDKSTGRWLHTQVQVDQQGKVSLATTERLAGSYATIGKQIGAVHGALAQVYSALRVSASYMVAGTAIYALTTAFVSAKNAIFEFDQSLKNLQAITMATGGEVNLMGEKMKQVASTTKFSATEIGDAMIYVGQAGFTATESIQTIQAVANLATGTLSSLTDAANLLTTTLRVFHLDASESARASDVFANAVNKSKTTVDKLNVTMNYLGPIAHSAGLSIEESASAIMLLSNAGIRASTIGTGFRQVLSRLLAPTASLRLLMRKAKLGLDDFNAAIQNTKTNGKGFQTVVKNLGTVIGNDVNRAFQAFGLRGANVALILSALGEDIEFFIDQASESGTAAKMAEIQMEGLQVAAKNMRDKFALAAIAIGEIFRPALRFIIDLLRDFADLLVIVFEKKWVQWIAQVVALSAALIMLNKALKLTAALILFKFMGQSVKTLMQMGTATAIVSSAFDIFRQRVAAAAANLAILSSQSAKAAFAVETAALNAGVFSTVLTAVGVAAKNLWLILLNHPIKILITALSVLVIAFYNLRQAKSEEIQSNENMAVSSKQLAQDYRRYADQLKKVGQGSAEFFRIQDRIMNQFPELGKELRDGETDLKGLVKVLEDMGKLKGADSLLRYAKHIDNLGDFADTNKKELEVYMKVLDTSGDYLALLDKRLLENGKRWHSWIPIVGRVVSETQALYDMLRNKNKVLEESGKEVTKRLKNDRDYAKHMAITAYEADRLNETQNKLTLSTEFYNEALEKAVEMGPAAERSFRGQFTVLTKMAELQKKYGQDLSNLLAGFAFLYSDFPDQAREDWIGFYNSVGDAGKLLLAEQAMGLIEYRDRLEQFNEKVEVASAEHIDNLVELERVKRFKEMQKLQTEYTRKAIELMERPYKVQIEAAQRSFEKRMELLKEEISALDKASGTYGESYKRIYRDINTTIADFYKEQQAAALSLYDNQIAIWAMLPKEFETVVTEGMDEAYNKLLDSQKNLYIEEYNEIKTHYSSMVTSYQSAMDEIAKLHKSTAKDRKKINDDLKKDLKKIEEETANDIAKIHRDLNKELRDIAKDRVSLTMDNLSDEEKSVYVKKLLEENYYKFKQALREEDLETAREYLDNIKALESEIIEGHVDKQYGLENVFIKNDKETYDSKLFWNNKIEGATKDLYVGLEKLAKTKGEEDKKERETQAKKEIIELKNNVDEQIAILQQQANAYKTLMESLRSNLDALSKKIYEIQQIKFQIETSELYRAMEDIKKEIHGFNSSEASKIYIEFLEKGTGSQLIIETIRELHNTLDELKKSVGDFDNAPASLDIGISKDKEKTILGKFLSGKKDTTTLYIDTVVNGKELKVPIIVPTISPEHLARIVDETGVPQAILEKAFEEALDVTKKKIGPAMQDSIASITLNEKIKEMRDQLNILKTDLVQLEKNPVAVDLKFTTPYGFREDGTPKGHGFLGEILASDGKVATEMSVGVIIDDKEVEIPLLVPTLTQDEINKVVNQTEIPEAIMQKAMDHAMERMKAGYSPFLQDIFTESFIAITKKIDTLETNLNGLDKVVKDFDGNLVVEFEGKSGEKQEGVLQLTDLLAKQINDIYQEMAKLNKVVTTTINIKTQQGDLEKVKEIHSGLDELNSAYKETTSTHKIEVKELEEFSKVNNLHEKLNGIETKSTHTIEVRKIDKNGNAIDPDFKPSSYNSLTGPERYYSGIIPANTAEVRPGFQERIETKTVPGETRYPEQWRKNLMERTVSNYQGKKVTHLNSWSEGMVQGMKRFIDEVPSLWEIAELATYNSIDNMSDALHEFFRTGKFEWQSFTSEILTEISKLLMKQSVARFLAWMAPESMGGAGRHLPTDLTVTQKGDEKVSPEHKETAGLLTGIWNTSKALGTEFIRGIGTVWTGIKDLGSSLLESFKEPMGLLSGIGNILGGVWSLVKFGFTQIVALLTQLVTGKMFDRLLGKEEGGGGTSEQPNTSEGLLSNIWGGVKDVFGAIWGAVKWVGTLFGGFWDKVLGALSKIPIVGNLFAGVSKMWGWLKNIPMIGKAISYIGSLFLHKGLSPGKVTQGIPRLHDGLKEDEFQAVLQKGERVVAKNDVHYEQQLLEKNNEKISKVEDGVSGVQGEVKELKEAIVEASDKSYGTYNQTHEGKGLSSWVGFAFALISSAVIASLGKKKGKTDTAQKPPVNNNPISYTHNGLSPGKVTMPRLHKGLMKDEFPAILQKGERVVAKKEVHYEQKLLESIHKMVRNAATGGKPGLSVNVPIEVNALDSKQQHLTGQLQSQIEKVVLSTLREYAR